MDPGVSVMGRPKKKPGKDPGPKTGGVAIHVKGSPEYIQWLDSFQDASRHSKATLVRWGLELLAEKLGHPPPPKI